MRKNHEAFGPESNNPRQRRAFAHAQLARLATGDISYKEAQEAVKSAGDSEKSANSGLRKGLTTASNKGSSERRRREVVAERGLSPDASW